MRRDYISTATYNSRHRFLCLLQTRFLQLGVDHLRSRDFLTKQVLLSSNFCQCLIHLNAHPVHTYFCIKVFKYTGSGKHGYVHNEMSIILFHFNVLHSFSWLQTDCFSMCPWPYVMLNPAIL